MCFIYKEKRYVTQIFPAKKLRISVWVGGVRGELLYSFWQEKDVYTLIFLQRSAGNVDRWVFFILKKQAKLNFTVHKEDCSVETVYVNKINKYLLL